MTHGKEASSAWPEVLSDEHKQARASDSVGDRSAAGLDRDRIVLRDLVGNLIDNALKFSQLCDLTRIGIGVLERGREFHFYVKGGFDMRYKEKLFGLFQRLHAQEEFEGDGVGLAKGKRIVLRHGGRVWAEGEVERGTCFWFALPGKRRSE